MQALIWFSMSHEYNEFFKTEKKGVYDLKAVDKKINESIKKVTGNELDNSNKEIINKAMMEDPSLDFHTSLPGIIIDLPQRLVNENHSH